MTVEHIIECPDCGGGIPCGEMILEFCEMHDSILRAMLIQRGFGADCELTREEREAQVAVGELDTYTHITQTMLIGVVKTMGPSTFEQYNGCPVCVLEGTLERSVDEIISFRARKN